MPHGVEGPNKVETNEKFPISLIYALKPEKTGQRFPTINLVHSILHKPFRGTIIVRHSCFISQLHVISDHICPLEYACDRYAIRIYQHPTSYLAERSAGKSYCQSVYCSEILSYGLPQSCEPESNFLISALKTILGSGPQDLCIIQHIRLRISPTPTFLFSSPLCKLFI